MGRKPKAENGNGEPAARAGHNGFDATKLKGFVSRVENLEGALNKERSAYMLACKAIREDIKLVLDEAKDAGIPKKEFKAVIKTRNLQNKLEAIRDDLEGDQQETYDQIRHALGDLADLPLGEASMAKSGAVDSLTQAH